MIKANEDFIKKIIMKDVEKICARYKISFDEVMNKLMTNLLSDSEFVEYISERYDEEDITRLKKYKDIIKKTKKQIYYELRQYKQDRKKVINIIENISRKIGKEKICDDEVEKLFQELLFMHTSTKERLPWSGKFYATIFKYTGKTRYVLDLGCGLQPISFPYDMFGTDYYVAIDKDPIVIDALSLFSKCRRSCKIIPLQLDLLDSYWRDHLPLYSDQYDLTFMLKIIPVLQRNNKDALKKLSDIPSKYIVVSGNVEALTRYEKIYYRERRIILKYIENVGREIIYEFNIGNEFGYIIR